MEIIGTTLSVAKNLTEALQCWEFISDKLSVFSYESELHDLQQTVEKITAVLRDAETKQELSHAAKVTIEALKDAIFDADDLLDEIVTRAHQQKQVDADRTLFEKVRHFFSTSNPICVSYWMSGGIKDIKKKLDAIAYNNQFSFNHDPEPIRNRRPDTCSYVNQVDIVGRGDDLEKIVGMLLHPSDDD
uniref:Disease resistance N-terminal domain-containing protein n=1 Tax=Chenopodium quinoa TaxID=63459 RepID=A0A803MTU7_CHEQI